MKKQSGFLRRLIILALLLLCILAALTAVSFAADYDEAGYCGGEGNGTNLTWTLDYEGTLTISGTGKMEDYENYLYVPWTNSKIQKVIIENGVTSIGTNAFIFCKNLSSITIPVSVASIGSYSFTYCSSLSSVTIPANVTCIGVSAFEGCTSLAAATIPASVTSIGGSAFRGCSSLISTTLPYGITNIEDDSFKACRSLKEIVIPDSVTSIGEGAFEGCGMESLNLPNYLTSIGDYAFSGCSFTAVTIPASVYSIGKNAFGGCRNVSSIRVVAENTVYDSRNDCNAIIETQTNTLILGCKNTVIPNTVTSIGDKAMSSTSFTSIEIPDSVTSIGSYAFAFCSNLVCVTIQGSVTSIGSRAFADCHSLTSIMFLGNVDSIGDYAFSYCNRLEDAFFCGDAPKAEMVTDYLFAGVNKDIFKIHYTSGKAGWTDNPNIYFEKEGTWHGYKLVLWDGQFVQFRQATPQSVTIHVQNKEEAYVYAAIYENGRFVKTVCKLVPVNAGEVTFALGMDELPEGAVIKAFVLAADGKTPLAKNAVWTVR